MSANIILFRPLRIEKILSVVTCDIIHDELRAMALNGILIAAVGKSGVKFYTAPLMGQGRSEIVPKHARLWSYEKVA